MCPWHEGESRIQTACPRASYPSDATRHFTISKI